MSGLNRDDMLRELELLPMWKLRQPLRQDAKAMEKPATVDAIQHVNEAQADNQTQADNQIQTIAEPQVAEIIAESLIAAEPNQLTQEAQQTQQEQPAQPVRALPSEDGAYLFLMQPTQALPDADAELLLQNMLRAMRVTCRTETQNTPDQIFAQHTSKLIICFGAETAEILLQRNHTMAEWRSQQPHRYRDMPLIVTFSPEHLLKHHQDKAHAWQDLCMAMQMLQDL